MEALSSSLCRSCRLRCQTLPSTRTFASTALRQAIPPESPTYVDVPISFQDEFYRPRRRKGVLPVPRELFPAKRSDKPSQSYLDSVTKDPMAHNVKSMDQLSEVAQHRVRMAEIRKKHLREGLTELYKRKQATISKIARRSHAKQTERERLISQAEREDSRLTSTSVPSIVKDGSSTSVTDQLAIAKAKYEMKKANYERVTAAKEETRLDALHTLYMNARSFITTEEQLNEAITEEFDNKQFRVDEGLGQSMWVMGPPETIKDMVAKTQVNDRSMGSALSHLGFAELGSDERFQRDQQRMKRIAEKLSGGKI